MLVTSIGASAWASTATVVKTEGKVWVTPPDGKETAAAPGAQLDPGTRVRTGPDGSAELKFENGSLLKLRPNSSMSLSGHRRASNDKNSVVLFFGRMWSKVTKGGDDSYEVKTANAVCGVRGTEFETGVADDGSVRVRVTEGKVGVEDEDDEKEVDAGEEVEGDEDGTDAEEAAGAEPDWKAWNTEKQGRLEKNGRALGDSAQQKIMARKAKIESLREQQKKLESDRKTLESRARRGDKTALEGVRRINGELARIADAIADLADEADSQFGIVDHYADLAERYKFVDRKYLVSQAASLRRVKAMFDAMVKDGTDISAEAMDALMDDMGSGKGGGLQDKQGSSADDLFGGDDEMK